MDELKLILLKSLENYFTYLENTGYIKDNIVNQLLVLSFLLEFILGYLEYIELEDYNKLGSLIECIINSNCIIPNKSCDFKIVPDDYLGNY